MLLLDLLFDVYAVSEANRHLFFQVLEGANQESHILQRSLGLVKLTLRCGQFLFKLADFQSCHCVLLTFLRA